MSATTRCAGRAGRTAAGMYHAGRRPAAVAGDPRFGVVGERRVRVGGERERR